jgi:hypothetical protein
VVVEELIGRLSLQTKGIDQARQGVKLIGDFRKALQGLAGTARGNFDGPAKMVRGFREAQRAAERVAATQRRLGAGADFSRADASARKHLTTMQRLRSAYVDTARAASQIGRRPAGGSWIQDEIRSLRRYKAELAAVTKQAGMLGVPRTRAERGAGLHYGGPTSRLHERGAEAAREGVREARDAIADTGEERARQQLAGMTPDESARLRKRALELSTKYPSLGQTELEEMGRSARNAMPNFDMALQGMESLAQFQVSQQSSRGIKEAAGQLGSFLKALDNMGRLNSLDEMNKLLEGINRATNVEGKELAPRDFLTTARNAKSAGSTLSVQYLSTDAATLMQDMGPHQFGTAVGTMLSQMVGGRATKQSKRVLEEAGLGDFGLTKATAEEARARADLGIKGKGTLDQSLLLTDPTAWAEKHMIPALQKKGVDTNDDVAVTKAMSEAFSAQTVANFWTKTLTQLPQLKRNRELYGKAPDLPTSARIAVTENPKVSDEAAKQSTLNIARQIADQYNKVKTTASGAYTSVANQTANLLAEDPATRGTAALGAGAAGAVALKWLKGRSLLKFGRGLVDGKTPGATSSPTAPPAESAAPAKPTAPPVEEARPGASPRTSATQQASMLDVAARSLTKLLAAAAIGPTSSLTKGDQDALVKRLGRFAQEQERAKQPSAPSAPAATPVSSASTTTPNQVAAAIPNTGAVEARLSEIQSSTQTAADKMKSSLEFTAKPNVDASGIDAAIAKAQQLKSLLDGARSAAASAGSGLSGAGLAKGSNTFTSPGATAP